MKPRASLILPSLILLAAAICATALFLAKSARGEAVTRGPGDGLAIRGATLVRGGEPFTGITVDTFPGGSVRARTAWRDGRMHGESREFYASGKPRWTRAWRDGLKEGVHTGWWENGNRMFEYRYHRDLYRGVAREWYADGKPSREMRYEDGRETGLQRAWRENGTLYANYEARDGRQYGVINARLCFTVKDGNGTYAAAR